MGIGTNTRVQCARFDASNLRYPVPVVSDAVNFMYGRDLRVFALENISRAMGWVMAAVRVHRFSGSDRQEEKPWNYWVCGNLQRPAVRAPPEVSMRAEWFYFGNYG